MKAILLTYWLFMSAYCVAQPLHIIPGKVDSLRKYVARAEGIDKAKALSELAKVYTVLDIDSAKLMTHQAIAICRQLHNDTTFILIASNLQDYLSRVGEKDLARSYLIEARDFTSEQSMIPRYRNLIYVELYFNHFWFHARYDSSVYYGLLTVDLAPDSLGRADRYIIIGAAYNKMGDNIKALEYYNLAHTYMTRLKSPILTGEFCYLYNQLGMLYSDEKDLKRSEEYFLKSVAYGRKAGGFPKVNPLNNLAVLYDEMGQYEKSLNYLDSAAALLPLENDPWREATNVRNKGKVLTHAGKPKEGIATTLRAMAMFSKLKEDYTVARLHYQLAEPYRLLGDYKTAEREALIALEWDREFGYGELVKECYRELALIYEATGQYQKAFDFQSKYLDIIDSLNSAERQAKFRQLETNFEFTQQERAREELERRNELYLAAAQADRTIRISLIFGTIVLAVAVVIAMVAYRRMRTQNITLNEQNKRIEEQANQLAEVAKVKSRFFANVSHELRTPVTLLNGMLELMQQNPSAKETQQKMEIALGSSRRLQSMLDEVLDLSRVETGRWKLSRRRQELFPLLNRTVLAFESLIARKGLKLDYDARAIAGLVVDVDEDKFEKVINNLMFNAVKFNRDGGWIKIVADRTETSVVILVTDSGIGIPEKELPYVFDPFYQSESTERLNSQGIGIGLSLVREFTELHGGDVSVTSRVNEGSCFTLQLPIASTEEPVHDATDNIELPEVTFDAFSRKPHVLIVEDNDDMRFYLKEILGDHVSIAEACNGKEGVKWLTMNTPDLIISDVMMPGMNGHEFLAHLKSSTLHRGVPVVMLTARAAEEDVLHGLSLGVDDYIVKPFNAKELQLRVHNLLANLEIRREWSQKPADAEDVTISSGPSEDQVFLEKVKAFVEDNIGNSSLDIAELADHLAMSERQVYRRAATLTGMTPAQLIKEIRLKIAYRLLLERKVAKVADLAKRVGFENSSYFSRQFLERFGKRPTELL